MGMERSATRILDWRFHGNDRGRRAGPALRVTGMTGYVMHLVNCFLSRRLRLGLFVVGMTGHWIGVFTGMTMGVVFGGRHFMLDTRFRGYDIVRRV